jgi:hypothetical protein
MRRVLISTGSALLLTFAIAGSAFAAHCINESKRAGAGVQGVVLINPATEAATFVGANAAGRLPGGFADLYLDLDFSGTLTAADLQVGDDVFLISNHSHKANPAQGLPGVLPQILDGSDPGGHGRGVGVPGDH